MKKISPAVYLLFILASCQSTDKTTDKADDLVGKFNPFLTGTWVTADYIDDITKTRSPLKSSEKLTFITEFSINTTAVSGDSIRIEAGFGNHEGGDFVLYFLPGHIATSLLTDISDYDVESNSYELGYVIKDRDTSLVLYHYDKNKKLLDKVSYIKVSQNKVAEDAESGLQYIVNKKLLSGVYKVTDASGREITVKLTDYGKIIGLQDFNAYFVLTDFVASPEGITDEVCFKSSTKDQKCYRFELKGDTLSLFETAKDEMDTLFKPGPAVYKLVKQH